MATLNPYGTLWEDLPPFVEPEDGSCTCNTIEHAEKHLPDGVLCPHCKTPLLDQIFDTELTVVGTHNGAPEGQRFARLPRGMCSACNGHFTLTPEPIIYNANHDVYYSGRGKYLPVQKDSERLTKTVRAKVAPLIQQWCERRAAGEERLGELELTTWIQYAVEDLVCELLDTVEPKS